MKKVSLIMILCVVAVCFMGCDYEDTGSRADTRNTLAMGNKLQENQPTPSDIDYSLERYNLIRRTYWVNGQREKARTLPCEIADIPLGYIVLVADNGSVIGKFTVEGKVSSLNSYLTPDSEYYSGEASAVSVIKRNSDVSDMNYGYVNKWLPDVDGSYGENDKGIFFFTPDGKYIEWTGTYLYSDIPFIVKDAVVTYKEVE